MFKTMTEEQQEMFDLLYHDFGNRKYQLDHSKWPYVPNEELHEYFRGFHSSHIVPNYNGLNLTPLVDYYRKKKALRTFVSAFLYRRGIVPRNALHRIVHGAGRYPVLKRLSRFFVL
jgi:hypothetical protein